MSRRTRSITAVSIALALVVAALVWLGQRDRTQAQAPTSAAGGETPRASTQQPEVARDAIEVRHEPTTSLASAEPSKTALAPIAATEPVSCTVLGFVRPPQGAQLDDNVGLDFTDHLGHRELSVASTEGAYSITGLAPGTWWVACHAQCGSATTRIELDAREPERRLDLRLARPPEVRVRVTSTSGEPIEVANCAIATLESPGEWVEEPGDNPTQPCGVGHFELSKSYSVRPFDGYIGSVVLDVGPPVFISLLRYQRVLATQRIERLGDDAEFVIDSHSPLLEKCTVLGRAVDAANREPLAGAVVMAGGRVRQSNANAPGVFEFRELWPGHYDIVVMPKRGLAIKHVTVLLEPGATLDLGDVEVLSESWINALVVDQQGHPVSAHFRIEPFDGQTAARYHTSVNDEATSNDDGSLHLGGLAPAKYLLKLATDQSRPWGRVVKLVDTSRGPVEGLRIEVAPGVDLVVRAAGESVFATRWTIRNSDGLPAMSPDRLSVEPQAFRFAPGTYTVEVETPNGAAPVVHEVVLEKDPVELVLP